MTRFTGLAIAGCLASTLISAPAYATPFAPDPTIGIRGIGDPPAPPITDGSPQILRGCGIVAEEEGADPLLVVDLLSFFCAAYRFEGTEGYGTTIFSVDTAWWNNSGTPIPVVCNVDGCNFFASGPSQFQVIQDIDSSFLIRLRAFGSIPGECIEGCDSPIVAPALILLWVEEAEFDGGAVSLQRINGLDDFQNDLATPGQPLALAAIPEPASLVLLGTGVAALAARRRRSSARDL